MSTAACPECSGPYLYGLTFQHVATCPLYADDTATAVADRHRLAGTRPATPTETRLAAELGHEAPEGYSLAVSYTHDGIHHRRITGTIIQEHA